MTITAEQAAKLLDRVPEFADILRKQASLSRDRHLFTNLHNAADWMDYLARELAASDAARKLAEERLAKAVEALQEARNKAHSHAHDGYDGVWLESDFAELTPKADAILKEIDND